MGPALRVRIAKAHRGLAVTLVLAGLVLSSGCRQIVGIEGRQVFDAGASSSVVQACGLPTRGAACGSCVATNCCTQAELCAADSTCSITEQCVQACAGGDSPCRLGCSKRWDPVNTPQAQLQDCRDANCPDACGNWDCLGNVSWQIPDPLPTSITISATAKCGSCGPTLGIGNNAGVHVRACSIADPECKGELASGYSADDGSVSLTLPLQGKPAAVFLEFHKAGWLDDLVMLDTPPISFNYDVGDVIMDERSAVDQTAQLLNTAYDPSRAVVKLRVSNCNLRPDTGIDVAWPDQSGATIDASFNQNGWDVIAVNLPVPANLTVRVVASLTGVSPDAGKPAFIASANLIVRGGQTDDAGVGEGAITLAPFVTPTP